MAPKTCYRKVNQYKFQLTDPVSFETGITGCEVVGHEFIELTASGKMTLKKYYAWNGITLLPIQIRKGLRPSLVHDAFYQLIREEKFPHSRFKETDLLFYRMIRKERLNRVSSKLLYFALKLGNGRFARPRPAKQPICLTPISVQTENGDEIAAKLEANVK